MLHVNKSGSVCHVYNFLFNFLFFNYTTHTRDDLVAAAKYC